jgi:hypothetical protein
MASVNEEVMAWAETRLATIAGFAKLREAQGDNAGAIPYLNLFQDGETADLDEESGETRIVKSIAIGCEVQAADGKAAAQAMNDAYAKVHNALMPQANWSQATTGINQVRPAGRQGLNFVDAGANADIQAYEEFLFEIEYAHADEDANAVA